MNSCISSSSLSVGRVIHTCITKYSYFEFLTGLPDPMVATVLMTLEVYVHM